MSCSKPLKRYGVIYADPHGTSETLPLVFNQHFRGSRPHRAGLRASPFLKRKLLRKDRDPEVSEEAAGAQREAINKYYAPAENGLYYLKDIHQPTLVVQGSNDVIVPTVNSYILQQNLPNAQLILYPDASHGSFYQYPELFVSQANQFLTSAQQGEGDDVIL